MKKCRTCGKDVKGTVKQGAIFTPNSVAFCCSDCFIEHVTSMNPFGDIELRALGVSWARRIPLKREFYSPLLKMYFRSRMECDVAEALTYKFDLSWGCYYESCELRIDEGKSYVPDFYLSKYGVFLEVKGEWRIGAKTKFEKALSILGQDRLLLIPPLYNKWFKFKKDLWLR